MPVNVEEKAEKRRQRGKTAGARSGGRRGRAAGALVAVADEGACRGSYDEEGVWVACDRCGKWRHLQQVHPPNVDVWYCSP